MPRAFSGPERERIRARLLGAGKGALARARRTPVEELARSAGISKGAFYLFFPAQADLWRELWHGWETAARVALRAEAHQDGPDRVGRVVSAVFREVLAHPAPGALSDPDEAEWWRRSVGVDPGAFLDPALVDGLYDVLLAGADARPDGRPLFRAVPQIAIGLLGRRSALGEGLSAVAAEVAAGVASRLAR